MEPFAEVSCILKVDVHCDACKMKMVEVLSSVCGVYALTINAEKGEVNVCGEVDPNLLVKALKGTGKHAEIVSVKLKHPALTPTTYYRPAYSGYGYGYGYNYSALNGPYGYYHTMAMSPYYSMRRPMMEHPHYYGHPSSYPRWKFSSYPSIAPSNLVILTITYKLDRSTDLFLNLMGPALSNLATGCPWPCMPVMVALCAQKVKRWSDFLVFSASRTVFHHNRDAVVQLLRVCFAATLGLNTSSIASNGGVGALLGHGFGSHFSGGISPVAPGMLYLRVHRAVPNVMFMTEVVSLLMHSVRDIASSGLPAEKLEKLKKSKCGMKYGQVSLAVAMTRVRLAASLGASLVWITGGVALVQSLIKETLPSWFISAHGSEPRGRMSGGLVAMLRGYALAYLAVLSGTCALDGKISLGCNKATWRAYVSGFISLMVGCTPSWLLEVDVEVLKRLSMGLKQWNEEELALALLGSSSIGGMGAAAEMIIEGGMNFLR
ncbi:hypothetical protein RND71_024520 [Anisodus tanguticus]|uniref:HMA domain-containing protein n=1 Tax=Anisodus tanguticus TaxID=243964 RepID=A0AAE1RQV2_9SOLA|nr:hypothetical protein RND71_024520 [Anisodus tanguticus]